jgi:hypothetical protein
VALQIATGRRRARAKSMATGKAGEDLDAAISDFLDGLTVLTVKAVRAAREMLRAGADPGEVREKVAGSLTPPLARLEAPRRVAIGYHVDRVIDELLDGRLSSALARGVPDPAESASHAYAVIRAIKGEIAEMVAAGRPPEYVRAAVTYAVEAGFLEEPTPFDHLSREAVRLTLDQLVPVASRNS